MIRISTAAILPLALLIAGCATVTRGKNDVLEIITLPPGATVRTTNGYSCASTPCAIKMPRKSEFAVTLAKDRCEPTEINVTHKTSGGGGAALAGNVLVGGFIGLGVDAVTGASQELVPNPINVTMNCRS